MNDASHSKFSRRSAIGLLGAMTLLPVGRALADGMPLSGNVFYRERIMLPPDAMLSVSLVDVSLADAPSTVLASTELPAISGTTPFFLDYNPAALQSGHRYAIQARINSGEELLFITATQHAFNPGDDNIEVLLERVAGTTPAEAAASPVGKWLAEDINGQGVIDNLQSVLEIDATGAVSGTGGCNRVGGQATIEGSAISFGSMLSTQMACAPAAMDQESKFFAALDLTRAFRLDPVQQKLFLLDAAGDVTMQLAAHS